MNIYKKFFFIFLWMIGACNAAVADNGFAICQPGEYVSQCQFEIPVSTTEIQTYPNVAMNPASIFTFVAMATYAMNSEGKGLLCWDFDNNRTNWDNLRKLFNPLQNEAGTVCYDTPITCYKVTPQQWATALQTLTKPTDAETVSWTCDGTGATSNVGYKETGETILTYITMSPDTVKCTPCPNDGNSDGTWTTTGGVLTWIKFSTIADCNKPKSYNDERGQYVYDPFGVADDPDNFSAYQGLPCYYSGE